MYKDGLLSSSGLLRAFVLGLLLMTVGCNATNGWAMNRSGMKHYQRGNYAQARHQFARAIADSPKNADYRHNLAMSVQKQGDLASAERLLRHNLTIDAMHQPSYHALAQILSSEGRGSEAQDLIAGWAETQPYVPEANLELAWIQRENGNVAAAEQSLQNALKANPAHPTALAHLGQLYQESGRSSQAAAYYQRSLAAKWDQPEVQSRLATLTEPNAGSRGMKRSAMMQNSGGAPMMASSSPFGNDPQVLALEDLNANPAPRISRRGRNANDGTVIAAYPLPNFDAPAVASWVPAGTMPASTMAGISPGMMVEQQPMSFQQPIVASEQVVTPRVVESTYASSPVMASGPPLIPQADPAHGGEYASEMTASTPLVVDPH